MRVAFRGRVAPRRSVCKQVSSFFTGSERRARMTVHTANIATRVWRGVTPTLFALNAAEAHASYAQFKLQGLCGTFVLALLFIYVLLIDGLLLASIYKTARRVVLSTIVSVVLLAILASNWRLLAVLFDTLRDARQARLLGLSVLVATAVVLLTPALRYGEQQRRVRHRVVAVALSAHLLLAAT